MKRQIRRFLFIFLAVLILFSPEALAGTATVSWTANTEPDLAGYKIYYGTSPRTCANPGLSGSNLCGYSSSLNVNNVTSYGFTNLTDGQTYYFSVSAYDTAGNYSPFSDEKSKIIPPADTTGPTISAVTVSSITQTSATIIWTTNESSDTQIEYGLTTGYGSQTTLSASMVTSHSQALSGLTAATLYNYRVKSRDAAGNPAISPNYTFSTLSPLDIMAPLAVSNLTAANISQTSLDLTWTSPGDDGNTGTASTYDIRYSTAAISEANWGSAVQAAGEPAPLVAGTAQSYTVVGLNPATTYYFAIKTADEVPSWSGLSNIATAATQSNTCASFTYSSWSDCQLNNTQSRTVTFSAPAGCTGGSPVLSQTCVYVPPTCASFTYSGWGACQQDNTQSRTVTSSSPAGCTGGSPVLSQTCVYVPPTCASFTYSGWGDCQSDNTQHRTIVSQSPVNCTGGSPILSQSCTYIATPPYCTSFTYSGWGACQQDNTQLRTVDSSLPAGCTGGSPALSQACVYVPPTCASFSYSSWGACQQDNTQLRTVDSSLPAGCTGGSPTLSQPCTYVLSTCASFTYSSWGDCQPNDTQSRTITSSSPAGCSGGSPVLAKTCSYKPVGGGGSGGGGSSSGGNNGNGGGKKDISGLADDIIAPITPKEFTAIAADKQVTLKWQNPTDADFVRVLIVRKENSQPTSKDDGKAVYEGVDQQYTDINLDSAKIYYYAIYAYDRKPNYSSPVVKQIQPKSGSTAINVETGTGVPSLERQYKSLYNLPTAVAERVSADESGMIYVWNKTVNLDEATKPIYNKIVEKEILNINKKYSIAYFIHQGTPTTMVLGAGERGGVLGSYKSAYGKLPATKEEWTDAIKIANGRWPSVKSAAAEARAVVEFKKIYKRSPDMKQPNDNAAVTVISYGLRPVSRNTNSEKAAIKSFKAIYGPTPKSAADWDIVRAIAYSGAKR